MNSMLSRKHSFDTVFDSQKVFRSILEAMSNPARVVNISAYADKLFGGYPVFLAIALTLLDNEVFFNTCENSTLSEAIISLTLARRERISEADFIFVGDEYNRENNLGKVIENAKCGTLSDPHQSATIIVCSDGAADCQITLSGPGIDGQITIFTAQIVKEAIMLRDAQYYEYPQGIDFIFVSAGGDLLAIPRLTRLEAY